MATHSSILGWKIQWAEEPGGLHSTGSQRAEHTQPLSTHTHVIYKDAVLALWCIFQFSACTLSIACKAIAAATTCIATDVWVQVDQ